jgi:glycosyltransferase involved in cell wall biosynthesis
MPRLLIVYQHLPHYRHDVFQALEETPGWVVDFAAGTSTRDPGIETDDHASLRRAHLLRNIWIGPFLWQQGLLKLIREDWDHVVFLGDYGYLSTWVAAAMCRIRHLPVAFWTIGWHRREAGFRRRVRLTFYRLANRLLLYGEDGCRIGIQMGYPAARMSVVHNSSSEAPIRLEEDEGRLAEVGAALDAVAHPAVGAVIRLTPRKRLGELVDAVARIERSGGPRLSVVLAGSGPDSDALIERARSSGVDLHLVGPIYGRRALEAFYKTCLVTVVPSLAGLTTLQSLKYGRPVLTHDDPEDQVPEYRAIRPGSSGDLYRKGDPSDLGCRLLTWIGKVTAHPDEVAAACHEALESGWTPKASAGLIINALENQPPRPFTPKSIARRRGGA